MNTSEPNFPCHQEVLECDGRYAIIWYKGAYYIGYLNKNRKYIRNHKYATFREVAEVYNQLLEE